MKRKYILLAAILYFTSALCAPVLASAEEEAQSEDRSPVIGALLYIPNRIFDIFDIIRLRVRVGPGVAASVRATELASVYLGTYASVFAGLPGPRGGPSIPLPVGLESHNGVTVSVADGTVDGGIGPDYGATEIGLGFQLLIVGVDFGVDPAELLDFVAGILTIDFEHDDFVAADWRNHSVRLPSEASVASQYQAARRGSVPP